ncbi:MAG: hypothetical protein J0H54_07930, partial [Rhizobiales bacterium]|nr:hypothetical protein [Hyphomicrobiales bacterium]
RDFSTTATTTPPARAAAASPIAFMSLLPIHAWAGGPIRLFDRNKTASGRPDRGQEKARPALNRRGRLNDP